MEYIFLVLNTESFIQTIAIVLLVYFALRFILKMVAPYIMRFVAKKAQQKMEQAFKGFESMQNKSRQPEEDIPRKSSKIVGEYIDFEEID